MEPNQYNRIYARMADVALVLVRNEGPSDDRIVSTGFWFVWVTLLVVSVSRT